MVNIVLMSAAIFVHGKSLSGGTGTGTGRSEARAMHLAATHNGLIFS